MAAVQGGHTCLVTVAGPEGAVGPPPFAGAGRVPAGATLSCFPAARLTRADEEESHRETKQRDRAPADCHPDGPQQHTCNYVNDLLITLSEVIHHKVL